MARADVSMTWYTTPLYCDLWTGAVCETAMSLRVAPRAVIVTTCSATVFTRCQFWPSGVVIYLRLCVYVYLSVCQSHECPRNNSGPVQARITKFGPKMQKTLVRVPVILWTDRPWPSRSNLTSKSKFTPLWACPHHNSTTIQARITKFVPKQQNT